MRISQERRTVQKHHLKRLKQRIGKKDQEIKELPVTRLPRMKERRHYIDRHPYMKIFQHRVRTAPLLRFAISNQSAWNPRAHFRY